MLFLLLQLHAVDILLVLESVKKGINDLNETSSKILIAFDSLKEAINGLNTTSLEILAALDSIKTAKTAINGSNLTKEPQSIAKTIQEMDPAKKQVICPDNLL